MIHYVHFHACKYSQSSMCLRVCIGAVQSGCVFQVKVADLCEKTQFTEAVKGAAVE